MTSRRRQQRPAEFAGAVDQAGADRDVVAAAGEVDADGACRSAHAGPCLLGLQDGAQRLDHLLGRAVGGLGRRIRRRCRPRHRSDSAGSSAVREPPWDRPGAAAAGGRACARGRTARRARRAAIPSPPWPASGRACRGRYRRRRRSTARAAARRAGARSRGARRRGSRPRRISRRTRRSSSRRRARSRRRRRRTAGRAASPAACRWRSCPRPSGRRGRRCAAAIGVNGRPWRTCRPWMSPIPPAVSSERPARGD